MGEWFVWIMTLQTGIILNLLLQKGSKKVNTRQMIFLTLFVVFCITSLIGYLLKKAFPTNEMVLFVGCIYQWVRGSVLFQLSMIVLGAIIILFLNNYEDNKLTPKKMSEKIRQFTDNMSENSTVCMLAGDMNFFGKVRCNNDSFSDDENIDSNPEYKQLIQKKNANKIKQIKIICSHKLENAILNEIRNGTYTIEESYQYFNREEKEEVFQQLLRIGKLKAEFDNRIEFRFYDDIVQDKGTRARIITSQSGLTRAIVYSFVKNKNYLEIKSEKKYTLPYPVFISKIINRRIDSNENVKIIQQDIWNYTELESNEEIEPIYKDLFDMKWEKIGVNLSKQIATYCKKLYLYSIGQSYRKNFALVYVQSYEVAHHGNTRKEFPPFGVLYLAAVIRNQGWKVKIFAIDENNYTHDFSEYDIVGYSIISSYSFNIFRDCVQQSKFKKGVFSVAGGYHAEKFRQDVFRELNVKIIFSGEGENSMKEFLNLWDEGEKYKTKGIYYQKADGTMAPFIPRKDKVDLDKIPFPARNLLPTEDIVMRGRVAGNNDIRMVHMLFSRGCANNCYYCAAHHDGKNTPTRYRSPDNIYKELSMLISDYGINGFSIIDDCFLTDEKKAIKICNKIAGLGLKWSLAARVDQIARNPEILKVLKKAGCIEIKFGVETGSDEILRNVNKKATVDDAKQAIQLTSQEGINVKCFIVSGLPGETQKTNQETIDFLQEMKEYIRSVSLLRFAPLPGSHIYEHPVDFGINGNKLNMNNFQYLQLYHKTTDWWLDSNKKRELDKCYNSLKKCIESIWGEC